MRTYVVANVWQKQMRLYQWYGESTIDSPGLILLVVEQYGD